ncbi:hypothetical protein CYMTET_41565 [Cymbomonas tetramitiformis]|uniref:rRNA methyltransferase 2, mitochondrial n=1 Tax=Cymbomonas tetramitiformis TaxID=36881 RepID=A0AAE0C5U5_9CHLO|nr:hypothetical protein CYMTET_41565 [Cymbomonas tetramitiformis]
MKRNIHDFYFKEAKRLGYIARSAFKLQEIQQRHRVVQKGGSVLDLGCSPGAWLQIACRALGPRGGNVLGLDLKPTPLPIRHCDHRVHTIQQDATELDFYDFSKLHPPLFTTVLSDMCPDTSGSARLDVSASLELAQTALGIAVGDVNGTVDEAFEQGGQRKGVLRQGGNFVVKILEGSGSREFGELCKGTFTKVVWMRPKATREESREVYLIGLRLRKQVVP